MTYKALIRRLEKDLQQEAKRAPTIHSYDARRRTEGRVQGLRRAIRAAKRLQGERLAGI